MNRFQTWKQSNPKKFFLIYLTFVFAFCGFALELLLRAYISYDPGYYMGFSDKKSSVIHYPYGDILVNSHGYMDDEFAVEAGPKPRVAYIGDSVCTGVGAGHGYRISEYMEEHFPAWEHVNFGGIGSHGIGGYQNEEEEPFIEQLDRFQVDAVIYLMNLNDVMPSEAFEGEPTEESVKSGLGGQMFEMVDSLRGKSYLYNFVRTSVKNHLTRQGYEAHGYKAAELFPVESKEVFDQTADRVEDFAAEVRGRGMDFLIVLLPYEMQISSEADAKYQELGISWEDGFVDRGPQKLLLEGLKTVPVVDAYSAFVENPEDRAENGLGEFFVYNRGDKLDWNHPNREGHEKIADFMGEREEIRQLLSTATVAGP